MNSSVQVTFFSQSPHPILHHLAKTISTCIIELDLMLISAMACRYSHTNTLGASHNIFEFRIHS